MVFVLVRALLPLLRGPHTSRSIIVRRGLAAAYDDGDAASALVTGLQARNEQRLSGPGF